MSEPEIAGVGRRVAEERKLKGWTQQKLADKAKVSLSLVRAVEQGRVPASPSFVSASALALKVGVSDLTEQPFRRSSQADLEVHASIPAIRRELASYCLEPDDSVVPRTLDEIATDVDEVSRLRHSVNLGALGNRLPGLLEELRAAVYSLEGVQRERAYGLLAEAYAAASQLVYKLGYIDLSSLTVERYEWAAAKSDDELTVLVGDYQRAGEMIGAADWTGALRFLERSRSRIESDLGRGDGPTLSMWGNLHLKSALAAARMGDRSTADAHLAEARETADRLGVDRDDYQLCFGPTNVDIWSVGLAVEMLDGTEAVKRAERVNLPMGAQKERIGHYYIDLARGYLLHGDKTHALESLNKAKETTPAQTRFHPMVHETIRVLAREDRTRSDSVHGFAAWCGISSAV
jgi:transcriptional regulator with XRE-family HTH domain